MKKKCLVSLLLLIVATVVCGTFPVVSSASSVEGGTQAAQQEPAAANPAVDKASQSLTNINTANAVELEKLSGIGPKIAEEIVKYRDANGPFKTVEDLKSVKGIGIKKFESIQAKVTVE
jgi:competence protein ComEA